MIYLGRTSATAWEPEPPGDLLTRNTLGLAWPGGFWPDIPAAYAHYSTRPVVDPLFWAKTGPPLSSELRPGVCYVAAPSGGLAAALQWCHAVAWAKTISAAGSMSYTAKWIDYTDPNNPTFESADVTLQMGQGAVSTECPTTDTEIAAGNWIKTYSETWGISVPHSYDDAPYVTLMVSPALCRDGSAWGVGLTFGLWVPMYGGYHICAHSPGRALDDDDISDPYDQISVVSSPIDCTINDQPLALSAVKTNWGSANVGIYNLTGSIAFTLA